MADEKQAQPFCAAGALFVDDEGSVMIVEPVHQATWDIPGGAVQRGESPLEACRRKLTEELGIDLEPGRLLVVDWAPLVNEDRLRFVYDGGVLTDEQLDAIELRPDELSDWAFVPPEELFVMLNARLTRRLTAALDARAAGETRYLEQGNPITPP